MSTPEAVPVAGVVHIQVPTPVWNRRMFAVAILLAAFTMFFFALGQWQNAGEARRSAAEARGAVADTKVQNAALKAQVDSLNAAQECRSQRSADLSAYTSDITGEIGNLVVLLTARDTNAYGPVLARLKTLSEQRAVAAEAVRTAVDDCKGK